MPLNLPPENPGTIGDVIELMTSIDNALPESDGVKWFNQLYLVVTRKVDSEPTDAWQDSAWLERLDVVFAGLYFDALRATIATGCLHHCPPQSWEALFESRNELNIDRIQFALAGMNAHINHDLAWALLTVNQERNIQPGLNSPQHRDFEKVNQLLKAVLPDALAFLHTGRLGNIAVSTGLIGRLLAMWSVEEARNLAWDFSETLRQLPVGLRPAASDAQDRITGVAGRGLLLPIDRAVIEPQPAQTVA